MVWIEISSFCRGSGVGWAWNCLFSVSHLFQLSCPSWRVTSIVTARHKCNIELPTGPLNCNHMYRQ